MKVIFAVFAVNKPDHVTAALAEHYPDDHLSVGRGAWLLSAEGTAKSVANKLGMKKGGPVTQGMVVSIASYNGMQTPDVWEWITAKWERG